ncbi:MAG TPA: hypothetical protein VJX74_01895 [Blastocatellia bacterium]|nr:hypothetical protein [Blastocatellia bacterium]
MALNEGQKVDHLPSEARNDARKRISKKTEENKVSPSRSVVECPDKSKKIVLDAAISRNTGNDQSMIVRSEAGTALDGRRYVSIEEGASEIPFDEIEYESPSVAGSSDPLVQALTEDEAESEEPKI